MQKTPLPLKTKSESPDGNVTRKDFLAAFFLFKLKFRSVYCGVGNRGGLKQPAQCGGGILMVREHVCYRCTLLWLRQPKVSSALYNT